MNNEYENFLRAVGDGINIAIWDFYEEHGKDARYQLQNTLFNKPKNDDEFLRSWSIEVPNFHIMDASRFIENGNGLWHVIYVGVIECDTYVTRVKYWDDQEPDVFVHAFPC